jgi:hypothetical protein
MISTPKPFNSSDYNKAYYARISADPVAATARKEKARWNHIKRTYGLSKEEWLALHAAQNHECAICGSNEPNSKGGWWDTDHCHATGVVRGILCHPCNVLLGHARDDKVILEKAIKYLN